MKPTALELLAPARNAAVAKAAIDHGADAVYMGGPAFGARAAAGNSIEEIREVVEYAHAYHARVYVTVNTIVYEGELKAVRKLVDELYAAGVDALIVQDMAFAEMPDLPPIALHASTQCDIRTPQKAARLAAAGFEQLVLPRELTLDEILAMRRAVPADVELEAFVHGALCVSYSGDCQAGFVAMGRSANRGECPQICRLPYVLTDRNGKQLAPEAHYLSMRDMKRIDSLGEMAEAGVSSFKIEGRLKDENYVKNVVAAYSAALDTIVESSNGKYIRRSYGKAIPAFTPDLDRTFNRAYTEYFLHAARPASGTKMASTLSPKWAGQEVARVEGRAAGGGFIVREKLPLANGDGLTFAGADGKLVGFRLNRVERQGQRTIIFPAGDVPLKGGMTLLRNVDKAFQDQLRDSGRRVMELDMTLDIPGENSLRLTLSNERGVEVAEVISVELAPARTPQEESRRKVLGKLGDTRYQLRELLDSVGDNFVPASVLTGLRRKAVEALDRKITASLPEPRRRFPQDVSGNEEQDAELTYHDNVANHMASRFYARRGFMVAGRALEVLDRKPAGELRVMTTRYCLRRELGACLRTPDGAKLPAELWLQSPSGPRYRLNFDCARCRMEVIRPGE